MRRWAALIGAWVWAALAPAMAQPAPAVEAYGRLPAISDVAISPNGEKLAIAANDGERSFVRIINLATGADEFVSAAQPGTKVRGVGWGSDRHALFYVSETAHSARIARSGYRFAGAEGRIEYWRTGVIVLPEGRQFYAEADEEMSFLHTGLIVRAPYAGDPESGRMISWGQMQSPRLGVFRVDLNRGRARSLTWGEPDTVEIILNDSGAIGARVDTDQESNRWRLFLYENGMPRLVMSEESETGAPLDFEGFLSDGRLVMADRRIGDTQARFFAVNRDGSTEVLAQDERYDVGGAVSDPWTHHIVGARWTEDFPRQLFFEPSLQAAYEALQTRFADGYATIETWSQDKSRLIVHGETAGDAGVYYLFAPAANSLRVLGRAYPEVAGETALGMRQAITYRARDGQRVPAYLTLPGGVEARNLPLVLLVHGGPHARDSFTFDWWASFLASRGYAVLQANYRGSTGYGHEWFSSGRGGWGDGVMQTDLEDGVDALARAGMVDSARVCIMGASYGGYAALAGATLTPQRYRCAAAIAGVSDLLEMLDNAEERGGANGIGADWWRLSIGDPRSERAHLRAISPANLAANVQAPILIMHGVDDTVVPIGQSRQMAARLRDAHKDVRFIEMQGDDHWLSNAATRTQMLRELDAFLAEHLRASD